MKKGIIVLLITVLAAGFVFAAEPTLSGSVSTKFSYDFDGNHDFGFNPEAARGSLKSEFTFSFDTISTSKAVAGENAPYAEVEAKVTFKSDEIKFEIKEDSAVEKEEKKTLGSLDSDGKPVFFGLSLKAEITKANIVGNGWTVDLLKAKAGSDYAKAAIDLRKASDKKYYALDYVYGFDKAAGITVDFTNYGILAVGLAGNKDNVNASIFAETAADLLKFNEVALQFAGTFTKKDDVKKLGASAKASYEADKLAAGVAADFGYAAEKFDADVAVNAKYEQDEFAVSADAYYATKAEAKDAKGISFDSEINYLGAKAVADAKVIKTDVTVEAFDLLDDPDGGVKGKKTLNVIAHNNYVEGVDVTVSGLDLINDARDVSVEASTTLIENVTLGVYGKELINKQDLGVDAVYTGIENVKLVGGVEYVINTKQLVAYGLVGYSANLFDCYARADFSKFLGTEGADLGLSAGIESDKLVQNATLSLVWAALDRDGYTTNNVLNNQFGKVVAACEIKF